MAWTNNESSTSTAGSAARIAGGVGTTVASASSITVSNFVTPVSGTTTVNTISGPVAGEVITLVSLGGFSLGTGGNITGISETRFVPTGQSVVLTYDGTSYRPSAPVVSAELARNAAEFGLSASNSAADNDTAWAAILAYAAAHTSGMLLEISGASSSYKFSQPVTFAAAMRIRGVLGGLDQSTGAHYSPILEYTGAGTMFTVSGAATANSTFEDFNIDHSGTADRAFDIDNNVGVKLRGVGIVEPQALFAVEAVRVGQTSNVVAPVFEDVIVRNAAPVHFNLLRAILPIFSRTRTIDYTSTGVKLGDKAAGVDAKDVVFNACSFEQSATNTNTNAIDIERAETVLLSDSYFENYGATGFSIRVDSAASGTIARNITMRGNRFALFNSAEYGVSCNLSSATLSLYSNTLLNLTGGAAVAMVKNTSCKQIVGVGNYMNDAGIPFASASTGVLEVGNYASGATTVGVLTTPGTVTAATVTASAGTGTETFKSSGTIHRDTTQAATPNNTNPLTAATYTLPANTLATNGDKVIIRAWGYFGATVNAKTIRLQYAGNDIANFIATTSNAGTWVMTGEITRTAASAQITFGQTLINAVALRVVNSTLAVANGSDQTITVVLTNGTNTADDIVFKELSVYYEPA